MKTAPIHAARIDFSDPAVPRSSDFGDVYHARAGALGQARHVFLQGNGLPKRWAQRPRFVILETGFGLGNNFLATWDAWRQDPSRCERLVFIGIEKHPPCQADLAQAHEASALPELAAQLVAQWPVLSANAHRLSFEGGRVELLLCLGELRLWSRELLAEVDAFYLDGFAPALNPQMWDAHQLKALGRRAAAGATAASWSVAPQVREALAAAGFASQRLRGFANKGGMCAASYQPRHRPTGPAGRQALAPEAQEAVVLGAGLAGAACAWALARQGIRVTVIDARPAPAQASSGNPAGLFHGTLNPDDGLHARFNRAAALETERALHRLAELPGLQRGLLRLETGRDHAAMLALVARLGLPAGYVQALDADQAAALSGLALRQPAWWYPGGGALPPSAYVDAMLRAASADMRLNTRVARVQRIGQQWQLLDDRGQLVAETSMLVLAAGHDGLSLLPSLWPQQLPALPLQVQRGQLSHIPQAPQAPRVPVAGLGYAIKDGRGGLWCGATAQDDDLHAGLRAEDHRHNLLQWSRLAGLPDAAVDALLQQPVAGRVGWRLLTPDRLPVVGGIPAVADTRTGRSDQPRFLPRQPGLALCTAMGSRGIAWAALCGEVLAAQVSGAPCPLEASLVDAIDPARFAVRATR